MGECRRDEAITWAKNQNIYNWVQPYRLKYIKLGPKKVWETPIIFGPCSESHIDTFFGTALSNVFGNYLFLHYLPLWLVSATSSL